MSENEREWSTSMISKETWSRERDILLEEIENLKRERDSVLAESNTIKRERVSKLEKALKSQAGRRLLFWSKGLLAEKRIFRRESKK